MRLTVLSMRVVAGLGLGAAGWVVAAGSGGCGHAPAPKDTLPLYEKENVENLPMEPAWRRFADENYLGVVLSQLGATTGPEFPDKPSVIASRNKTRGTTELMAAGSVDTVRPNGKEYRRPYVVVWEQAGTGWRLLDARVEPASVEAPAPPPERIAGPATRPATAPAAGPVAPAAPGTP